MQTVRDIDTTEKRVLVRVDFNVPLNDQGEISDDSRIRRVLPTLEYLLENRARLIVASHLGRPGGKRAPAMSLAPVARRLGRLLGREVHLADDCVGAAVESLVASLPPGGVVLLENLRFQDREQKNDDGFAARLAALCDVYVNDAFAVSHRANASVVAVTRHAPVSVAGLLLEKEIDYYHRAMTDPKRPLAAVVGGAKVSSKLAALQNMLRRVDRIVIGGAMANTFLLGQGYALGNSRVEKALTSQALAVLETAANLGVKAHLPVDFIVAESADAHAATRVVAAREVPADQMALDIGPATVQHFSEALRDAKTIVWNGPMGVFEMPPFSHGTQAMAKTLADSRALTIVGGGETGAAVHRFGQAGGITYISTGGGAFLALLEGKTLPAVAALDSSGI